MFRKIVILNILIYMLLTPVSAFEGNSVNPVEYPSSDKVLPVKRDNSDYVVSGSVEKNIDLTLDNCIELALGNNPSITAAFQEVLASDARIKQVWANYFPQVSWQTGYTRMRQLQLSDALGENLVFNYFLLGQVTLQQMLYDFGVTQNEATIKRLNYEGSKSSLAGVINDVIYKTKDAYYNLLLAYESERVAQDTVDKFQLFYDQAKAFYEIGMNPKVDVTIAESNLSNAKLTLIQANNGVNLAIAKLNNIMGVPYIQKYTVPERLQYQPMNISFEEVVNIARDSRPELKLAEIKVEAAHQTLNLTKKAYFPKLTIEGQYQIGGKSFTSNYGYNFGGYLNFPVINGMKIRNQIKESRYLYDKEIANAQQMQNAIYLEIQNAFLKMEEKKNQMPVALLQVKQAKENYDLSYGRYRVGEASPTELKDSQIMYENAQLTYYKALYQYNSAKAELEKAVGKNIIASEEVINLAP